MVAKKKATLPKKNVSKKNVSKKPSAAVTIDEVIAHLRQLFVLERAAIRAIYLEPDEERAGEAVRAANLCFDGTCSIGNWPMLGASSPSARERTVHEATEAEHFERTLFRVSRYDDGGDLVFWAIASQNRRSTDDDVPRPQWSYLVRRHPEYGVVVTGLIVPDIEATMRRAHAWALDPFARDRFDPREREPLETRVIAPMP